MDIEKLKAGAKSRGGRYLIDYFKEKIEELKDVDTIPEEESLETRKRTVHTLKVMVEELENLSRPEYESKGNPGSEYE